MTVRHDSDTTEGHHPWQQDTAEARRAAEQKLTECRARGMPMHQSVRVPQEVRTLQALVFNYRSKVEMKMPRRDKSGPEPFEDWDVHLMDVEVPKAGTYDGGLTDEWGEYPTDSVLTDAEFTTRPVNLATLKEEWGRRNSVTITVELDNGTQTRQQRFQPCLSVAAADACIEQISRVVEDIGWTPPAREKAIHAEVLE